MWFKELSPLSLPLGGITAYARTTVRSEYALTRDGLSVKESIPKDFVSDSIPASVSTICEYR